MPLRFMLCSARSDLGINDWNLEKLTNEALISVDGEFLRCVGVFYQNTSIILKFAELCWCSGR